MDHQQDHCGRDGYVALIDDDEAIRDSLSTLLELHGHRVRALESAEAFLAERDAARAWCLILDINLPGMSGLELLSRLRAAGDTVPVILVTGRGTPATQTQVEALKIVELLEKPVAAANLFAALDRAYGARGCAPTDK